MADAKVDRVRGAVEPVVRALGLELYDLEIVGAGAGRTLRVTVTRDKGVDLDTITAVTQAVSPLVDKADALAGSYLLEVSSPGIERALRRPEHYRGAIGEQVSIKTRVGATTRRVHGTLVAGDDTHCVVETDDGTREDIAIDDVTQARTVFAWGPQQGQARARKASKQRGEALA